jgi:hypothetical protein
MATRNRKRQGPATGVAHNIVISWSGERSKKAAEALHGWLQPILQAARLRMSESDIEKGTRGLDEVARALGMKHRNPVTRRLVTDPKDWVWSSYASYSGRGTPLLKINFIP